MMALCLLLCGCGGKTETEPLEEKLCRPYQTMTGCSMEAEVTCAGNGEQAPVTFTLRCDYLPEGESVVEVLSPETAAGIRATVDGETMKLEYEDLCLPVETRNGISPATCLPRLMDALREGWLLEANREELEEVPCLRLCLDRTGADDGEIWAIVWLREEDGIPLRGEIAVEEEIILQARFTKFTFGAILSNQAEMD